MPCLILSTYKWLDKFEHRPFVPSFKGFGNVVRKVMIPVFVIFVIVIVPSFLASNSNSFSYGVSKIFNEKTKTGVDTAKIEKALYPMDDAVGVLDVKLTKEDVDYLEELYVPHPIVGAIKTNPKQGVMLLDEKK